MTEADWTRMRELVRNETRKILFEDVDDREPEPTNVREALRLSADHARGFPQT